MKFVDITNDVAFRKIFGNENRKEVLISFLNAVLLFDKDKKIVTVDILTPYQLPAIKGGKVTIVDVKAKTKMARTISWKCKWLMWTVLTNVCFIMLQKVTPHKLNGGTCMKN